MSTPAGPINRDPALYSSALGSLRFLIAQRRHDPSAQNNDAVRKAIWDLSAFHTDPKAQDDLARAWADWKRARTEQEREEIVWKLEAGVLGDPLERGPAYASVGGSLRSARSQTFPSAPQGGHHPARRTTGAELYSTAAPLSTNIGYGNAATTAQRRPHTAGAGTTHSQPSFNNNIGGVSGHIHTPTARPQGSNHLHTVAARPSTSHSSFSTHSLPPPAHAGGLGNPSAPYRPVTHARPPVHSAHTAPAGINTNMHPGAQPYSNAPPTSPIPPPPPLSPYAVQHPQQQQQQQQQQQHQSAGNMSISGGMVSPNQYTTSPSSYGPQAGLSASASLPYSQQAQAQHHTFQQQQQQQQQQSNQDLQMQQMQQALAQMQIQSGVPPPPPPPHQQPQQQYNANQQQLQHPQQNQSHQSLRPTAMQTPPSTFTIGGKKVSYATVFKALKEAYKVYQQVQAHSHHSHSHHSSHSSHSSHHSSHHPHSHHPHSHHSHSQQQSQSQSNNGQNQNSYGANPQSQYAAGGAIGGVSGFDLGQLLNNGNDPTNSPFGGPGDPSGGMLSGVDTSTLASSLLNGVNVITGDSTGILKNLLVGAASGLDPTGLVSGLLSGVDPSMVGGLIQAAGGFAAGGGGGGGNWGGSGGDGYGDASFAYAGFAAQADITASVNI
ncbi:hypothetical protein BOTBODRAFT_187076 [Botryobasidium botryosum FD-172 SS1]|uniref:Uncharacterized protein n=1 Tax=Botryobasidium botryosum (strain FD-172 SS1) TaxID=930990 RepID=A0A067MVM0_BOTB1|nr:hypothetical protein BOTBODRAFT_187076 [Botryobasidium botryosum FD-172 SS1]